MLTTTRRRWPGAGSSRRSIDTELVEDSGPPWSRGTQPGTDQPRPRNRMTTATTTLTLSHPEDRRQLHQRLLVRHDHARAVAAPRAARRIQGETGDGIVGGLSNAAGGSQRRPVTPAMFPGHSVPRLPTRQSIASSVPMARPPAAAFPARRAGISPLLRAFESSTSETPSNTTTLA